MAIRKFKVEVIIEKEYEIEIDDTKFDENFIKDFTRFFHEIEDLKDIAKDLAVHQAILGSEYSHIEGYGNVTRNNKAANFGIKTDSLTTGLNINLIHDEGDITTEINEIKL